MQTGRMGRTGASACSRQRWSLGRVSWRVGLLAAALVPREGVLLAGVAGSPVGPFLCSAHIVVLLPCRRPWEELFGDCQKKPSSRPAGGVKCSFPRGYVFEILGPDALHRSRFAFYAKRHLPRNRLLEGEIVVCDDLHGTL